MSGQLGCAGRYTAKLHWRGGGRVYSVSGLGQLTSVEWGRTLNDVSSARITVAKRASTPECCEEVGATEPWIHELAIYRDLDLVWQGPVIRTVENRDELQIEAVDVLGWLERLVNTWVVRYVADSGSDGPGPPPANGRYRRPITQIAENIIRLNVVDSPLSVPPDWCGIMDHIVRRDPERRTRFEKDGSSNSAIWRETVLAILEELGARGLYYTTVGRTIFLTGRTTLEDPPMARLSLADIIGNVEVIRDGTSAATFAFATNQQANDISGGTTVVVGTSGTEYGRLDVLVRTNVDFEADNAEVEEELTDAARAALGGRYPAPIAINVPDGAQLSPTAPVQVRELVCGQRVDLVTQDYCTRIGQPFVISDVSGSWASEAGEQIGVALIPLAAPYGAEQDVDPEQALVSGVFE